MNLIDPEQINDYLRALCEAKNIQDSKTQGYIEAALAKALRNDPRFLQKIDRLPDVAPAWLRSKWPEGGPYYRVDISKAGVVLHKEVEHVIDWIGGAAADNDRWLTDKLDSKGRPHRLMCIKTLEDATRQADKDMRLKAERLANQLREYVGDEETIAKFDSDGSMHLPGEGGYDQLVVPYRMVRLHTAEELDYETAKLGHCIGNGNYDKHLEDGSRVFYSLRDTLNIPHATLEVHSSTNSLLQCKGKQNVPPVAKYMPCVQSFVKHYGFALEEAPSHTGLIEQDGHYYDICRLPDGLHYQDDLDLRYSAITALPKNLHVDGNLDLRYSAITALRENLHVDGNLNLRYSAITALRENLHVGGNLDLAGAAITALPKNLYVGGNLDLRCSDITEIPSDAVIVGKIYGLDGRVIERRNPSPDNLATPHEAIVTNGRISEMQVTACGL